MNNLHASLLKRHSVLATSLAASLGIHALGLYFLISHPMMLHHSLRSLFGLSIAAPDYLDSLDEEALAQKNHVVEEIFEHIVVFSSHLQQPFDLIELPRGIALSPNEEDTEFLHFTQNNNEPIFLFEENWITPSVVKWDIQAETLSTEYVSPPDATPISFHPQIQMGSYVGSYDLEHRALPLEEQVYIIDPTSVSPSLYAASLETGSQAHPLSDPFIARSFPNRSSETHEKMIELDTSLGTHKLSEQVPFLMHPFFSKIQTPHVSIAGFEEDLEEYLPSTLATATEWNDDFDLDICFLPHPEGIGYIFSLALNPNFDISQYSLKHDVIFIIDRSVRKHRFEVFKRAVLKALSSLQQGDTFNIYIIDKKMTRLHAKSLPVTQKTIRAAEYFLEKQDDSILFSKGDIFPR